MVGLSNSPYTTNRILEIPQDIKLELNSGTLTLKAGSKVYIPNGFEADGTTPKFDVVTIESDISINSIGQSNPDVFVFYNNNSLTGQVLGECHSGNSQPTITTISAWWYDTSTNKLKYSSDYGSNWTIMNCTFPLCICSRNSGTITTINQIFNGFGYIGSTVFALPGVKLQFANGMDGNLFKALLYTTNKVTTYTFGNDWTVGASTTCFMSNGEWVVVTTFGLTEDNWCLANGNKTAIPIIPIFDSFYSSGKPTNVKFRSIDSVANSNASNFSQAGRSYLSGLGMPSNRYIDLTLGASGSTYIAPANGWFFGVCGGDVRFQNFSNGIALTTGGTSLGGGCAYYPVKKGETVIFQYSTSAYAGIRFVYAEGEN